MAFTASLSYPNPLRSPESVGGNAVDGHRVVYWNAVARRHNEYGRVLRSGRADGYLFGTLSKQIIRSYRVWAVLHAARTFE